jgi:hypothetical protein
MLAAFAAATTMGRLAAARADEQSGTRALADQAEAELWAGKPAAAVELAERGLLAARSRPLRERLWNTLAWAAIGVSDPLLAHRALGQLPEDALDFYLVAAYLSCCNRVEEAERLLLEARGLGHSDREATKLLIDLFFRRGNGAGALAIARADNRLLGADDWSAIEAAIPDARRS